MEKKMKKRERNEKEQVKKCISLSCESKRWRSDVLYCWECYKYEYFESR